MCVGDDRALPLWVSTEGQEDDTASPTEQKPAEDHYQNQQLSFWKNGMFIGHEFIKPD